MPDVKDKCHFCLKQFLLLSTAYRKILINGLAIVTNKIYKNGKNRIGYIFLVNSLPTAPYIIHRKI